MEKHIEEIPIISKAFQRKHKYSTADSDSAAVIFRSEHLIAYHVQDNFTVCVLFNALMHYVTGVGVAKREPGDKPDPLRGKEIALSRAIRNIAKPPMKNKGTKNGK